LTSVAAYGSYLLAEHFHLSGVLASLTAGLIVSNAITYIRSLAAKPLNPSGGMPFVANSFIFVLIGIRIWEQDFASKPAQFRLPWL
jgi:CPA1 family monovalent cation:H+ antiporter